MRLSCEAEKATCSVSLVDDLRALGVEPIITPIIIRAVYEGDNEELGYAIAERFRSEAQYGLVMDVPEEKPKKRKKKH